MYPKTILIALTILIDSVVAQTSSYPYAIDPNSVPTSQRSDWCRAQLNTCRVLCGGSASSNTCDSNSLSYSCTCSNGITPDCTKYGSTVPAFECQLYVAQCLTSAANDLSAQQSCKNTPCGSAFASAVGGDDSSTPMTSSSPSSSASVQSSSTSSIAAPTQTGGGSTTQNGPTRNIDFSYIQTNIKDIAHTFGPDGLTDDLFPEHVDIICENCTGKGYVDAQLSNGDSVEDFFTSGVIDLDFAGISTNVSLDVQLQSGFTPFNHFFSFYNYTTRTLSIGDDFKLSVVVKIGIPLQIELDSPVSFYGGFLFTLPDTAKVSLTIGPDAGVTTSGFDTAQVNALPYGYNAAGLTFSVITGLQVQISLVAINTATSSFANATGTVGVNVDIPSANVTFAALENVNSLCEPPVGRDKKFKYAAKVTSYLESGLNMTGQVKYGAFKWSPPGDLPNIGLKVDLPDQCLYSDSKNAIDAFGATVDPSDPASVAAGGAGNSAASGGANGNGSGGSGGNGSGGTGSGDSSSGGSNSGASGSSSTEVAVQEGVASSVVFPGTRAKLWWAFAMCVSSVFCFL